MSDAEQELIDQAAELLAKALEDEHVYLEIDGKVFEVAEMGGREKISELFHFDLVMSDDASGAQPFDMLGRPCVMTLHDGFGTRVTLQGIVAEAERTVKDDTTAELHINMRPNVFPLTLSRDSRVFIDKTVPQIVDIVLQKLHINAPFRWELTRAYRERVYTAQYREADWTFISRLLEEEGIYYWFDHEDADTVLVFSDDSVHAAKLTGGMPIEFVTDSGMLGTKELIHELAAEAHATPTKFTVGSFDPWNPMLKVMASEGDGIHEMYDAPAGGPEAPEVCGHQARNRLECALSHRASISGNSSSVRIDPGRIMEVYNHPLHDGSYFITEVVYRVTQRRRFQSGERGGYQCHYEGIQSKTIFRPPEDTPISKQAGIQSGRVVGPGGEEIHTDDRGRVRVQLHWDREGGWDDKAGKWMRVAQRGVSMSMMYPRVGWNVMTFMEEGNVDAPTVLTRVHDAEHPPTYPLPENKTKTVFRTASSPSDGSANEFRFEDLAGLQEMFINASGLMNIYSKMDIGQNVGRNHEKKVTGNQEVSIQKVFTKEVQNDQKVKIGKDEELEITTDRDKGVGGNEKDEIGQDRKVECGSNMTHHVEKNRELKVIGHVTEQATEGLIQVNSKTATVKIDGSVKQTVQGMLQEECTKNAIKTVGINLNEDCKDAYAAEVNDVCTEALGGNLNMTSGKHFLDGSDDKNQWTVTNHIRSTTKHVHMQAKERIIIRVGASSLEITQQNVTIRSPNYDLSNSSATVATTKQIKHN